MRKRHLVLLLFTVLGLAAAANAQGDPKPPDPDSSYWGSWFSRVDKTQKEQPHWITPLATTTPRLEEEYRYDIFWQPHADGTTTMNYGGAKGLELIPFEKVEVILNQPAYVAHNNPRVPDGYGDFAVLVKYRLLSSNEERGNYILTAFFSVSATTGTNGNGSLHPILTPTIAYGKGFRNFDVQGTMGIAFPSADTKLIGRTYAWNNAFQYRLYRKLWPEVEINSSFFQDGKNDGKKQVFITPGLVIGRLHLWKRVGFTVGGGMQIATTHFHTSNHNGILSVRFPF